MDAAERAAAVEFRRSPAIAPLYPLEDGFVRSHPASRTPLQDQDRTITPSVYGGYKRTLQEPDDHAFLNDKNSKRCSSVGPLSSLISVMLTPSFA